VKRWATGTVFEISSNDGDSGQMTVKVHFILNGETNWRTVTVIHEVNIIEVFHQRVFTNLPAKGLIADLNKAGYDVRQVELAD
jgi:hypothetical protein